jgi:protein TonB
LTVVSAAEAAPETTVKTEEVQAARSHDDVTQGAVAIESVPAPAPVVVATPPAPAPVEPAEHTAPPEPTWVKEPAAPVPAKAVPVMVPPATLKGLLASSTAIEPPDNVQSQMMRDEKKKTNAVLKLCIGADGAVTSASVAKSSGYPDYDQRLIAGVHAWHYRPYMIRGQATAACSAVAFAFAIQ